MSRFLNGLEGEGEGRKKRGRTEEYSSLRSGLVDLVESGLGVGDELDGMIRRLSGDAATYEEGIDQSRRDLDYFERKNPTASKLITGAGVGASLFIPGATAAKIAQAGTRTARSIKMGVAASAEGAAYGYLAGRDEERFDSALLGAGIGGALGAGVGRFLTKGADEYAAVKKADSENIGVGGAIGGDEGYKRKGAVAERRGQRSVNTSAKNRKIRTYADFGENVPNDLKRNSILDTGEAISMTARNWGINNIGLRPTVLVQRAELGMRKARNENDFHFADSEEKFKLLTENRKISLALSNLGKRPIGPARKTLGEIEETVTWDDVYRQADSVDEREALDLYKTELDEALELDFDDWQGPIGEKLYAPRSAFGDGAQPEALEIDEYGVVGNLGNLKNPAEALRELRNDISDARVLRMTFEEAGVDFAAVSGKKKYAGLKKKKKREQSRLEAQMEEIEKAVKGEILASPGNNARVADAASANMANLMRSVYVASRTGGDALGAQARKAASTALLATPTNAVLNLGETVTAPVVQNGISAAVRSFPQLIRSGIRKQLGKEDQKWLNANQLGVPDDQFAGELMNAGKKGFSKWLTWASKGLYKYTGTSGSHRMTQEALGNSAVKRGASLAKAGKLEKLRKHKGMDGLTQSEFDSTVRALKDFDELGYDKMPETSRRWLGNFAGASMDEWQAISPMSMPKALLDNPNGRVGYSMLSYMIINMNNVVNNVGRNIMKVNKYGLNSKEGQEAFRTAQKNSASWLAMFGVFAGIWDDMRNTLIADNDYEAEKILTFEGVSNAALNQIASNLSGGLMNIRAEQYGGELIDPFNPAPVGLTRDALNVGANMIGGVFGGEVNVPAAARFVESSVPGFSQANKLSRMGMLDPDNFERLLEGKRFRGEKLLSE